MLTRSIGDDQRRSDATYIGASPRPAVPAASLHILPPQYIFVRCVTPLPYAYPARALATPLTRAVRTGS